MSKNYYHNFSTKELAETYTTTMGSYGKVEGELLAEINSRGGETWLKAEIEKDKIVFAERMRIRKEVMQLTSTESDAELIKKFIHSDILSQEALAALIENTERAYKKDIKNKQVNLTTIAGCVIGIVTGTASGGLVWFAEAKYLGEIYYVSFVFIYLLAYLIIRVITKKNAGNVLVLVSALLASICSGLVFLIK
jgi:hypothetical protein